MLPVNHFALLYYLVSFGFWALTVSCSSSGRLISEQASEIILLDSDFEINARLGALPMELPKETGVRNYAVSSPGKDYEYLIMVDPVDGEGDLSFPKREAADAIESAGRFGVYLDEILEIHRQILAGAIEEPKERLRSLVLSYQHSYATYTLHGILALIEKKPRKAEGYFRKASLLLPGGQVTAFSKNLSGK